ncbi:DUF7093 family protein [Natrinema longum]|uniref:Uncharacterized protein n=1 Tax=Natrinema longum TaxID=370324 RepID=A0A8A2UD45_9EURY|nr:hypothetical protein [Natrinema longum]MBZ6495491.1 hypothetical protein [Natrinema longum]QSW86540.1 hypothetical protein J0X27_06915 [Natrinema longum]
MALRCSLLGHDFGDPDVEREREERGSEVVVTVQEYEECTRCGERNVISENTEVTSLTTGTDDSLPDEPDTEPPEPPLESDAETTDAEFVDAGAAESAAPETEPQDTAADAAATDDDEFELPTDENGDPVTDDGEILEDDEPSVARDRDHGEWPDSDDVGPPVDADSEPATWPVDPADDEPAPDDDPDPASIDDDAVVLESDEAARLGADSADGDGAATGEADARSVTADHPTDDRAAADADTDPTADHGTGIERADSVPAPAESDATPDEDVPTEFYCPRCEFVAAGDRGSLRTGDICPDCRKGYLSERERR